jgi:LAGLIDADG endonuclease
VFTIPYLEVIVLKHQSQRQIYTRKIDPILIVSNLDIMKKIAMSLNTSLINIHRKKINYNENAYLIRTDKIVSKNILFSYLDKYSLFGYKYFAQKNIKEIHDIVRSSKYKTEEGKLKFLELSRLIKYNENRDN